ncbi:MAG: aldehyde dehydrogenase family protein, partial [Deltaproteobacteria bacterium]|nr:aldehyde dehydrogenase family protein [Deltaproteobacteria bacterium]
MQGESRMFIDGELVDAISGNHFPNINPATEEIIGEVADAGPEEAERAIAAARRAFDESSWSRDHEFRRKCLGQLREGLSKEKGQLRKQVIAEVGAPMQLTYGPQCDSVINDLAWVTGMMENYAWDQNLGSHNFFGIQSDRLVWKEATGVVAAITPWNYPLQVELAKVGPALAAGCSVILKPAPDTPWCGTFLGRVAKEYTDIPPGVFNVITSSHPSEVGSLLTTDPRVDLISFTGSTAVGAQIMATAAPTIKKVFLELGGKSANIILDDADFDRVIPTATMVCIHAGQGCAMQTRLLLPRSRYDEGVEQLIAAFQNIKYG